MSWTTNFEQSEFIAKHFDENTADMTWVQVYDENHMMTDYELRMIPYKFNKRRYKCVPAWTLDSLMKLFPTAAYISIKLKQDSFGFWECVFKYEYEKSVLKHRTIESDKNGRPDIISTVFEMLKWLVENTQDMSFMQMNPLYKNSELYRNNEADNK